MADTINYKNITTNNLKHLDIELPKGCFWGIAGPSGAGKSSLAYGTIYAISQYEWEKVTELPGGTYVNFQVESYQHVIPAIALKQENYNQNPRSTIATFLRIDKDFRLLYAAANGVSPARFSFNNPRNACPYCEGLGVEQRLDTSSLVAMDKSILEKPFKSWTKGYYQPLLEKFAVSRNIPLNQPLSSLSRAQLEQLLYAESDEKFAVSYRANGRAQRRQFRYVGFLRELEGLKQDKTHISSAQRLAGYGSQQTCSHCQGRRFSPEVEQLTYRGKSLGELYMMEVDALASFIEEAQRQETAPQQQRLLAHIRQVLHGVEEGNLEYLHLNRSIPSLSGGELQRIRLINILDSQINGVLYVIDEPSAKLHVSEYDAILSHLHRLQKAGNTLLMIEHNPYFLRQTDRIIYVGPRSGDQGGELSPVPFPEGERERRPVYAARPCTSFLTLGPITEHNLTAVTVRIPQQRITGIYGPSGSGKSTLARNIQRLYPNTEYIDQKTLRGSKASTIATFSGLMDAIRNLFAAANGVSADHFSFKTPLGQCPECSGKGSVTYELDFGKTKVELICDRCHGKRYNDATLAYTYRGLSIYEVLHTTIDHLLEVSFFEDPAIQRQLELLQALGLGYLTLFRTTDTLSGGEAQRLKLMKFIGKRVSGKLFIFDEPLCGLSTPDVANVLSIFRTMTEQGATVIFIEHNVMGLAACDYVVEMGPGKGKHGGQVMFQDSIARFRQSDRWKIYDDKR